MMFFLLLARWRCRKLRFCVRLRRMFQLTIILWLVILKVSLVLAMIKARRSRRAGGLSRRKTLPQENDNSDPDHIHRWETKNPYENPFTHKTGEMFCMDCEFEANW